MIILLLMVSLRISTATCIVFSIFALSIICQTTPNSSLTSPCISFLYGQCVGCQYNYHLYQNLCYLNITGCLTYTSSNSGIILCTSCDPTISVSDGNGGCNLTVSAQQLASMNYYGSLTAQYGSPSFQVINLQNALQDPKFQIVNQYMLNGQYSYFISKTSQPVVSVAFYALNGVNNYKIIYVSSGGGLMLCIISIDTTSGLIRLISFVQISAGSIIIYCSIYGNSLQCLQCNTGYHLENGLCYANIQNCVSYSQNLCLQCQGFAILVENRCISDCSLSDLSQIMFYGDTLFTAQVIQISRSYLYS